MLEQGAHDGGDVPSLYFPASWDQYFASFLLQMPPPQAAGLTLLSRHPSDPTSRIRPHYWSATCQPGLCPHHPDPKAWMEMLPNPPTSVGLSPKCTCRSCLFLVLFLISEPHFPPLPNGDKSGPTSRGCWGSNELIYGTGSLDV